MIQLTQGGAYLVNGTDIVGSPGSSQSDTGEDRHYDLQRRSSEKHHGIWYSAGA